MLIQGDSIPDRMVISLKGMSSLDKSKLMMLEMLANCNWTRPLYVAYTVGQENYMNLGDNFVQEGLANRITPFTTNINGRNVAGMTDFDTEKTYHNVMERFKFGGVKTEGIYLDETVMRMCYTHRRLMTKLALNLVYENKEEQAARILERAEEEFPAVNVPHDYQSGSLDMALAYHLIGNEAKAKEILSTVWNKSSQYVDFFLSLDKNKFMASMSSCRIQFYIMQNMIDLSQEIDPKLTDGYAAKLQLSLATFTNKGGRLR